VQDFLRDRLTAEEREKYETYDGWAVVFSQFLVWPGLLGAICATTGQTTIAALCWAIAIVSLPLMLWIGGKARALLKVAEKRYLELMEGPRGY